MSDNDHSRTSLSSINVEQQVGEPTVTSLEPHLLSLLNNTETNPDVCFHVKGDTIYAHKLILSRSIVFRNMFFNKNFSDAHKNDVTVIDEKECSVEAVMIFLKYLYIDKVVDTITLNNVIEVSNLANKYSIQSLEQTCERYMSENCLNDDNIFSTFIHARMYSMKTLEANSLRYIVNNAQKFLDKNSELNKLTAFCELSFDDVNSILSDSRVGCSEVSTIDILFVLIDIYLPLFYR
jgi:hypothetical protein